MKKLIFVAALFTTGCAQQFMEAAHNTCQAYGYAQGSPAYIRCVENEYQRRTNAVSNALQQTGNNIQRNHGSSSIQSVNHNSSTSGTAQRSTGSCFFSHSTEDTFNKICYYKCLTGTKTTNISSVALCPLTMP